MVGTGCNIRKAVRVNWLAIYEAGHTTVLAYVQWLNTDRKDRSLPRLSVRKHY